ncbi:MAG: hypothetical protein SGBAC_007801, partial [Bacillariaceae sp.]
GGSQKCTDCLVAREKRNTAITELPDDMEWLKSKVRELSEHTGLAVDEEAGTDEHAKEEATSNGSDQA